MADARRGTVITVFSTASAVGKTLIAINIDVCNYLQLQPTYTLADAVAAQEKEIENFNVQAFLTTYDRYDVPFGVLAAPLKLEEAYNIQTSDVRQILSQLQLKFDFLVIDTAGIVDFIPTIKNMKSGNDTIHGLGYDTNKIRMILNRSNSKTRIDLQDVEQLLGSEFYHVLPNDFGTATRSIKTGCPLVLDTKPSPLKTELRNLVARYTGNPLEDVDGKEDRNSSWFSKLFR